MAIRQMLMLELSDIVGPENVDDMTDYILSFQDVNDIRSTLKDIIGNETVANDIAIEILKSRGQYQEKNKRLTAIKPKEDPAVNKYSQMQTYSKDLKPIQEPISSIPTEVKNNSISTSTSTAPSTSKSKSLKKGEDDSKHTHAEIPNTVPEAKCHCMGTVHPVFFNCHECGNIICTEEKYEVCTFCGAFSRHYHQTHNEEEEANLRAAIESKNRLLQYDRENTARSQVYDDQQDYFDLNDSWSGRHATAEDYKPVYVERSKQPIAITFDFAGRRVVMDERRVEETRKRVEETKEEEVIQRNTGGYYVGPGNAAKPSKSHSIQIDMGDHKYRNNTLEGKANALYESISKKLTHGLKQSEMRMTDVKMKQRVSKSWKKDSEMSLI